jgi:hypothetical protein
MVALALGLLAAVEADRVYDARREPLVALAARIAPLVPPDATLAAAPALPENDALVLRWLLHRAIPRRTQLACEPGTYVIATGNARARAAAAGLQVVATLEARRKGLLLLGCPGD